MQPSATLLFFTLAAGAAAHAAESSERASPVDRNAACMDRTVDASSGNCVLKDEGGPRRTHSPRSATPAETARTGAGAPASAVRNSGAGK